MKRELSRSHWSKSAQSFLCSDYRLAHQIVGQSRETKAMRAFVHSFVCKYLTLSGACLWARPHKRLKRLVNIFFPLTTTRSMSLKLDQILRCFYNWGRTTMSCKLLWVLSKKFVAHELSEHACVVAVTRLTENSLELICYYWLSHFHWNLNETVMFVMTQGTRQCMCSPSIRRFRNKSCYTPCQHYRLTLAQLGHSLAARPISSLRHRRS